VAKGKKYRQPLITTGKMVTVIVAVVLLDQNTETMGPGP
jgi:outer membrane receptor for monomeric catechols